MHHESHFKPFLSSLECKMCREYFSIIFNVKKCTLYLIKYVILLDTVCPFDEDDWCQCYKTFSSLLIRVDCGLSLV